MVVFHIEVLVKYIVKGSAQWFIIFSPGPSEFWLSTPLNSISVPTASVRFVHQSEVKQLPWSVLIFREKPVYCVTQHNMKASQTSSTVCPLSNASLLDCVCVSTMYCVVFLLSHIQSSAKVWLNSISSQGMETLNRSESIIFLTGTKYFTNFLE